MNPASAQRCDCGHEFAAQTVTAGTGATAQISPPTAPVVLEGADAAAFIRRQIARAMNALVVLVVVGVVGLIERHAGALDLVVGSIATGFALWVLSAVVDQEARTGRIQRSWLGGLWVFVPYLFGGYLVLCQGLLGFLDDRGSGWTMLQTVLCVLCGLTVVNGTYKITEVAKAVSAGRLRFK